MNLSMKSIAALASLVFVGGVYADDAVLDNGAVKSLPADTKYQLPEDTPYKLPQDSELNLPEDGAYDENGEKIELPALKQDTESYISFSKDEGSKRLIIKMDRADKDSELKNETRFFDQLTEEQKQEFRP